MSSFLKSTLLQSLRPIAPPREMDHGTITNVVEREVGEDLAQMLAEPVPRPDGTAVDWYSAAAGDFIPLSALDTKSQAYHRSRVDAQLAALQTRIDALEASNDASSRARAAALRIAAAFPGVDHIFVERAAPAGTEPKLALVDWGFMAADSAGQGGGPLTGIAAARRPVRPPPPPQPEPSAAAAAPKTVDRRTPQPTAYATTGPAAAGIGFAGLLPFILGLLTLLLILAIFWLLLTACALRLPFGSVYYGIAGRSACMTAAQQPGVADPSGLAALRARALQLEEELARRQQSCTSLVETAPVEEETAVPDVRFEQRLTEENRGDIQLTLVWNTTDDLDLFVVCPNRRTIYYNAPNECGAELDVDANRSDSNLTEEPVENIVWRTNNPDLGQYAISVSLAKRRSSISPIPFSVRVKIGSREQVFDLVHPGNPKSVSVHRFNIPS